MQAQDNMCAANVQNSRIVSIPTHGVRATDFDLSTDQTEALYQSGLRTVTAFLRATDLTAFVVSPAQPLRAKECPADVPGMNSAPVYSVVGTALSGGDSEDDDGACSAEKAERKRGYCGKRMVERSPEEQYRDDECLAMGDATMRTDAMIDEEKSHAVVEVLRRLQSSQWVWQLVLMVLDALGV